MPDAGKKLTKALCTLCGQPMPDGEQMFKFHGFSGRCPRYVPLEKRLRAVAEDQAEQAIKELERKTKASRTLLNQGSGK